MAGSIEIRSARLALAVAVSIFSLAAPSLGDERPWEQPRWHALDIRFNASSEDLSSGRSWLNPLLRVAEKHGFEYSRSLRLNLEKKFVFSIQGPLIGESAPGLAFELRF